MKNLPLVSIITPSYNQGKFIEDTILSIKNQDYPNIEHIIIDGGSTDETMEILERYKNTYNLKWVSEPDKGQSDAVNKGFQKSSGEIIGWLNSDDVYFDKNVILYIVDKFNCSPNIDVIYGDSVVINDDNFISRARKSMSFSYPRLLRVNYITQPSTFLRKNIITKHKIKLNLDLTMDYEYWLRIANNRSEFLYINKIISADRRYADTKTQKRRREMKAEAKRIRQNYGVNFNLTYYTLNNIDKIILTFNKIFGIKTIFDLYFNKSKDNLAFTPKFDSISKMLLRQILYIFQNVV